MRNLLIGVGGLCSAISGALFGYELFAPTLPNATQERPLRFDTVRSKALFSRRSESYDSSIDRDELMMGIKLLRWYLIRSYVTGEALEVSAGTGRNIAYYKDVRLTIADSNRDMLIEAAAKLRDATNTQVKDVQLALADTEAIVNEAKRPDGTVETTLRSSNDHQIKEPDRALRSLRKFPPESFDTVVDTFGLCSLSDPRKALQQMVRLVRPGGRVVLMEHGKGTWRLINDILVAQEQAHFERWGCHFNRDVDELITGLVAEEGLLPIWRYRTHFGTTICAVLEKPKAQMGEST